MTPPTRLAAAAAVLGSSAMLAMPSGALAKGAGSESFATTYPLASKLCARVAAGKESKHLAKYAASVTSDCVALETAFSQAQSTVLAEKATLEPQLAAARHALARSCPTPHAAQLACRVARGTDKPMIATLKAQLRVDVSAYFAAVESARATFWAAIHTLPGEQHRGADAPIPVPKA